MSTSGKKKLIRIKDRRVSSSYGVNSTEMNFAFSSAPDEKGDRYQAGCNMKCREYFNRAVLHHMTRMTGMHYRYGEDAAIDMEKLRFLVLIGSATEERRNKLFNAKAALNRLEEMAGFESTSKITTVKHEKHDNAWLITGPKEWMSQPQLLSLATWIIRVVTNHGPINVESYDSVEESLRVMTRANRDKYPNFGIADVASFGQLFWDQMYVLLKYRDEIFKGIELKKAWSKTDHSDFMEGSGFYSFIRKANTLNYSDEAIRAAERFEGLVKKHLPRTNPLKGEKLGLHYDK